MDGQLRIDAADATLAEILTEVAALTGVKIDIPDGLNGERMRVVQLGPGPTREILASLLGDSRCDYVIQASDTDPGKIQNVLVMLRERKGSGTAGTDAAGHASGPYAKAAPPANSEQASASDSPASPAPENGTLEASASNPQPDQSPPPLPDPPDQSMRLALSQADQSNLTKPAPLTPPANLTPQSINQQLTQMYQQRMQMNGQTASPATPANPGSK